MKKSKKSVALLIGSLALVLTFALASVVGYTFAKYVTNANNGTGTAQVAKWGVTLEWKTTDLFKTVYGKTDSTYAETNTVIMAMAGDTTPNGVAPGTEGSSTLEIRGNAEVAFRVTVNFAGSALIGDWTASGAAYEPVKYTVVVGGVKKLDKGSMADLAAASYTLDVAAGATINKDVVVSWEWSFTGDDAKDTILGQKEAAPSINLTLGAKAEQID